MPIIRTIPKTNETYHVYNRGVDKQLVFKNRTDYSRFIERMCILNDIGPVPNAYRQEKNVRGWAPNTPAVKIFGVCLVKNHYHIIAMQLEEGGISKYMQKIATSHTNIFNEQHDRSGCLWQGKYKCKHISSDSYMKKILAYVCFNYVVHDLDPRECMTIHEPQVKKMLDISMIEYYFGSWEQFMIVGPKIAQEIRTSRDLEESSFASLLID